MLRILTDEDEDPQLQGALLEMFGPLGVAVDVHLSGSASSRLTGAVDAYVIPASSLDARATEIREAGWWSVVVATTSKPTVAPVRALLASGVSGIIDNTLPPMYRAIAVFAAASRAGVVIPKSSAPMLAAALEPPPADLTKDEVRMLRLGARLSIEEAGRKLGFSRRQRQRRFKQLRDRLGLLDHRQAAVAAARWGLLERGFGHEATCARTRPGSFRRS